MSASGGAAERVRDERGYRLRVACVAILSTASHEKEDSAEPSVVMISSSTYPDRWILPGGGVELSDASEEAGALREAYEEAGIRGVIAGDLGRFENPERKTSTHYYLIRVTSLSEDFMEAKQRRRAALAAGEVLAQLRRPGADFVQLNAFKAASRLVFPSLAASLET